VTVTAATPGTKHWVGAYSPPRAAVNATAPVKYAIIHDVDASYLKTGDAAVRFRLACNRHDYDFVVFADDWERRQYNESTHARSDTVHEAVAVARSAVATMRAEANSGPRKPRVSLVSPVGSDTKVGDDLELAVTWSSARGAEAMPSLRWWEEDASGVRTGSVNVVNASTYRYRREDLCGAPATTSGYRDPGWIHRAALAGIDRSTVRFVGYDLIDALGGKYPPAGERGLRLRVPRVGIASSKDKNEGEDKNNDKELNKNNEPAFTIAMFADMGRGTDDDAATWNEYGSPAFNTSRALAADADAIDAAFLFGDVSYATGYQSVWDDYLEMIAPWAAAFPFLVNPGNHEYDYVRSAWTGHAGGKSGAAVYADPYGGVDSGGECGVPTERLLTGPTPASSVPGAYVAILGPIALVSMNTEVDFRTGSPQWTWLDRALGSIDRTQTPWVLFAGHRPGLVDSDWGKSCLGVDTNEDDRAWTCGPKKPLFGKGNEAGDLRDASDVGVALEFQAHVWPLLTRHEVNAVFSGHNHVYQRHCAFDPERAGSGIDSHLGRIRKLGPGDDADDAARAEYGKSGGCVARPKRIRISPGGDSPGGDSPASDEGENEWWVYEEPKAPVSLVVGSAGAGFTRNSRFSLTKGTETCEFCEVVMYEFGYLRVAAVNDTHLRCEFVETQRGDGAVLDRFYVTRRGVTGAEGAEGAEVTSGWRFIALGCALALFVACFAIDVFVPQDTVLPYVRLDSIDEDGEEEEGEAAVDGEV